MSITAVVVTADGSNSPSLAAVLTGIINGAQKPDKILLMDTSGIPLSMMLKGICRYLGIQVYQAENHSDIQTRLEALSHATGPCWLLDDDAVPSQYCLRRISTVQAKHGRCHGVQGAKVDIVRKDQFQGIDWNWANEIKPMARSVRWLDGCCVLVDAEEYSKAIQTILNANPDYYDAHHSGDVAVSAVYAAWHGATAVGNAFIYHIPNKPPRWTNFQANDEVTLAVLRKVLTPEDYQAFVLDLPRG
jgi:hypothetical protein